MVIHHICVDEGLQRYWSLVIYDEYGLPLPQYVHDTNVKRIPLNSKNSSSSSSRYRYNISFVNLAAGGEGARNRDPATPARGVTEVDVSAAPRGYCLFRLVHPTSDEAARSGKG